MDGKGVVFDLESDKILWSGLTKPHTPRMDRSGRQYICDSGTHKLLIREVDGSISEVCFPGAFTRGLAFGENHIYVGLSVIRYKELAPVTLPNARIAILDRLTLNQLGQIDLPCAEIYDIVVTTSAGSD